MANIREAAPKRPKLRDQLTPSPLWWWIGVSALIGGLLSIPLFQADLAVTAWGMELSRESDLLQWWNAVVARSLFEGRLPGAQDVSYVVIILALAAYFLAMTPWFGNKASLRLFAGYYLASMMLFFVTNRGLKAFFGRARPLDVLRGDQDYSSVWLIGPYAFSEAMSKGSFTSGHTTTAMFLLPVAVYLWHASRRCLAWSVLLLALVWGGLVGAGRVFYGSHYPGDVLWAMVVCLWVSTLAASHLFGLDRREQSPGMPSCWELRLTIWSALTLFALFAAVIGIKQMIFEPAWYWSLVVVFSAFFVWVGANKTACLIRY